jgi:hypothetical protein
VLDVAGFINWFVSGLLSVGVRFIIGNSTGRADDFDVPWSGIVNITLPLFMSTLSLTFMSRCL